MHQTSSTSNSSKYLKRVIAIVLTLGVTIFIFYWYLISVNDYDNILYDVKEGFGYDTMDYVVLGSSHADCSIDPLQLYRDYGITGFDLAGPSQTPWMSYYYLLEADKRCDLKLVVLDVYKFTDSSIESNQVVVNNLINYPFSLNRKKVIEESTATDVRSIFWSFPILHSDYGKFAVFKRREPDMNLGFDRETNIYEFDGSTLPDIKNINGTRSIGQKEEMYLRMIIEYCKDNGIELLIVNAPWTKVDEESLEMFNYIGSVAEEYGVTFVDGCRYFDDISINFETDILDHAGHLNNSGAIKNTSWLYQNYIVKYELPDHRGQAGYEGFAEVAGMN